MLYSQLAHYMKRNSVLESHTNGGNRRVPRLLTKAKFNSNENEDSSLAPFLGHLNEYHVQFS
jgi:hypothetical protein